MKRKLKIYGSLIVIAGSLFVFYYYTFTSHRLDFANPFLKKLEELAFGNPCAKPIEFSIAHFDTKFGISKSEFISDINNAGSVWEKAAGKNLFEYSATGTFEINLIYDARQEMTDELKKEGITISNDKESYDALKARYETLTKEYDTEKANYDTQLESFNQKENDYEKEVEYWNSQGGASKKEYQKLQSEKAELDLEAKALNEVRQDLIHLVDQINSLATILNDLVQKLNLKVAIYNQIGQSQGEEFSEGEYIEDQSGKRINIYQFETKDQLIRVLEHELGHALGLDHVDDPKAIMYYLNQSSNEQLTPADITELKTTCWVE
jgi:chromosome segregation ATPase